jgi:hypothetical protein
LKRAAYCLLCVGAPYWTRACTSVHYWEVADDDFAQAIGKVADQLDDAESGANATQQSAASPRNDLQPAPPTAEKPEELNSLRIVDPFCR